MRRVRRTTTTARRGGRGSVLLLFPSAVLVVLVLVALTLEHASIGFQQRELFHLADAAANDAATEGIDPTLLRSTGALVLDADRAETAARRSLAAQGLPADTVVDISTDDDGVSIVLRREVALAFTALPGRRAVTVRASAVGVPVRAT